MLPESLVTNEKIVKALWALRQLSQSSQRGYSQKIKFLNAHVNVDNPVETEKYILAIDGASKYKVTLLSAYLYYCKANNITWIPPRIKARSAPIIVPTEERIDKIIGVGMQKWVTVFGISKHGLRPDEVSKIVLRDIDLPRGLLSVRTSKMGAERTLKLKEYALYNLKTYIEREEVTSQNKPLFPGARAMHVMWDRQRHRAYLNFRDPESLKIRLYDLRPWFATSEYLKKCDIFHVKYLLGHRDIKSTLIYMHVAQALVNNSEEYISRVARTIDEALKLIDAGFEYVTEMDGVKLFRKRK
jgi:integrase